MTERFFRIEGVVHALGGEVVVPIEWASIVGDVSEEVLLDRYASSARSILRQHGYSDEEAAGADLRIVEVTKAEFDRNT